MRRHLRIGILACVVATTLGLVSGTASRALDLAVGILEMDSTSTCVLLRTPMNDRFLIGDHPGFPLGDTVVALFRRIEQQTCTPSDSYPYLVDNVLGRYRNYDLGCGWIEVRSGCTFLEYGWFDRSVRLDGVDGSQWNGAYVDVIGTFEVDCGSVPDCPADYCLREVRLEICPEPAVQVTSWGRVKSTYGP